MSPAPSCLPSSLPQSVTRALEELAAAARGPFGQKPLAHLAIAHFEVFAELRRLGASWAQIATLLAELGIAAEDGPFDAGTLRATLSRAGGVAAGSTPRSNPKRARATERNEAKHSEMNGDDVQHSASQRGAVGRSEANRGALTSRAAKQNAAQRSLHSQPAATMAADAADGLDQRDGGHTPPADVGSDVARRAGILLQTFQKAGDI